MKKENIEISDVPMWKYGMNNQHHKDKINKKNKGVHYGI